MITVCLPWPPTLNTYWRFIQIHGVCRVVISAKGRQYQKLVAAQLAKENLPSLGKSRLEVTVELYPPDRRKWDLENRVKAMLDSLQKTKKSPGVYDNDSQIDYLTIARRGIGKPARAEVIIREMGA